VKFVIVCFIELLCVLCHVDVFGRNDAHSECLFDANQHNIRTLTRRLDADAITKA